MTVDQIRELPGVIDILAINHTNMEEVMSGARNFNIVRARHEVMRILCRRGHSRRSVGRIMNRHKSTIDHAVWKV